MVVREMHDHAGTSPPGLVRFTHPTRRWLLPVFAARLGRSTQHRWVMETAFALQELWQTLRLVLARHGVFRSSRLLFHHCRCVPPCRGNRGVFCDARLHHWCEYCSLLRPDRILRDRWRNHGHLGSTCLRRAEMPSLRTQGQTDLAVVDVMLGHGRPRWFVARSPFGTAFLGTPRLFTKVMRRASSPRVADTAGT